MDETQKLKIALFLIIRNNYTIPAETLLGKTVKQINEMSVQTIDAVLSDIDYDKALKSYLDGGGKL